MIFLKINHSLLNNDLISQVWVLDGLAIHTPSHSFMFGGEYYCERIIVIDSNTLTWWWEMGSFSAFPLYIDNNNFTFTLMYLCS